MAKKVSSLKVHRDENGDSQRPSRRKATEDSTHRVKTHCTAYVKGTSWKKLKEAWCDPCSNKDPKEFPNDSGSITERGQGCDIPIPSAQWVECNIGNTGRSLNTRIGEHTSSCYGWCKEFWTLFNWCKHTCGTWQLLIPRDRFWPMYFHFFLLQLHPNESDTSTKRKTK